MYPYMCVMTYGMTRSTLVVVPIAFVGREVFHPLMYTLHERSWLICGCGRLVGMVCVCHMIWIRCIVMDCYLLMVQERKCTSERHYCLRRRKHDLHVTSVDWTHSASFMHQSTLSASPLTLIMLWKIIPLFWMFSSIQSVLWPAGMSWSKLFVCGKGLLIVFIHWHTFKAD